VLVRFLIDQVWDPRAAWAREILPAIAGGDGDEQSEQDDVGPDPRHQAVTALALGSGRGARNLTRTTSKRTR
jgi:hypothetical protein